MGDNKNIVEFICCEIGVFFKDEDFWEKSYIGCEFMDFILEKCKEIFFGKGGCVFL